MSSEKRVTNDSEFYRQKLKRVFTADATAEMGELLYKSLASAINGLCSRVRRFGASPVLSKQTVLSAFPVDFRDQCKTRARNHNANRNFIVQVALPSTATVQQGKIDDWIPLMEYFEGQYPIDE
ncbi:hypothetical protein SS50377_27086 [Spironucleus salmonicida]|uniref:Uncharacterized protein n=1 Tax=Spironucleus salmonicida TaxID=348837 RepID=V6LSR9_9EUKA|nr:hypothetical protein SS50377_27086 [Spironucleus salmonicida]|eukprot:EST46731.1 Hypothetical protein SS50377_13246 [Spironucleus salmonicida]